MTVGSVVLYGDWRNSEGWVVSGHRCKCPLFQTPPMTPVARSSSPRTLCKPWVEFGTLPAGRGVQGGGCRCPELVVGVRFGTLPMQDLVCADGWN